ncbi:MAG TPA: IspD/TarI family cytidylyltransferase [bacterium]|nr:IspD/TarI family cytidylyltransferase [bacterium]
MTGCIIVAAGKGTRFKSRIPKTLFLIKGIPVIEYCLQTISMSSLIDEMVVVTQKRFINTRRVSMWKQSFSKITAVVPGGNCRERSVLNGLCHCSKKCDTILVHDGARPFLSEHLISSIVKTTQEYGACVPVSPVNGSVKIVKNNKILSTIFDKNLQIAQTPQGFKKKILEDAFELNKENLADFPDDASLCMKAGFPVHAITGDVKNIKITTRQDLSLALAICDSLSF